ncbi:hypothetical protein BS78_K287500 [Paspalum vaginatum]|uniref:non-specific serine/threonine protein kinase n=1 Tax=Paspalum vaginatum TaxID=158149 RepID=A0A9W7XE34_9POAL|nr:hypothetical protein BS78_K287500 [Paspalum vaginatum]
MASAASRTSSSELLLFLVSTCSLVSLSMSQQQAANTNSAAAPPPPPFSFSFDFTDPSSYNSADLRFEGNATVHGNLIDLTCNQRNQSITDCGGRMSYKRPVPFYDDTALASFNTTFTFVIEADGDTPLGDGIAFFLSSQSDMPPGSNGGRFGLLRGDQPAAYGAGQFVAVEFDTYSNSWDPPDNHIGIDINTVNSGNTTSLPQGRTLSGTWTATITFDNITAMLSASLRSGDDNSSMEPLVVTQVLQHPETVLPREVEVGFSAATGANKELSQILKWSFNSTIAAPLSTPHKHKGQDKIILIIGVHTLVLLVLVVWIFLCYCKRTNRNRGFEKLGKEKLTRFEYRDLAAATEHFSVGRRIGEGFFGVVHRGYLKNLGCEVAIKEIKAEAAPGLIASSNTFSAELNAITSVKHKNLVKLFGWCRGNSSSFIEYMCCCWKKENDRLFLVYELVPKGSLHDHLQKQAQTLPWETRYKIVKDITSALHYLHHECDQLILHRDIKPGNILLDDNFNAKLADFGLSRIADPGHSRIMTVAVGSLRYLDPECMIPEGKVEFSRSTDNYSYGIVLLEIACGKQGMVRKQVWGHYINRSLLKAADHKLNGEFDESEMERVIVLGLWCSYRDSKKRPSMEQVTAVLEHGRPLPDLNSLDTTTSLSTR